MDSWGERVGAGMIDARARRPSAIPVFGPFPFTSSPAVDPELEPPCVDESALIARVLAGEPEAFHALFQRHSAPLLATLTSALPNREDAHEVLQETWLRAYQNLAFLRDPSRPRPWLLSIALNLARARHRRPLELGLAAGEAHEPSDTRDAQGILVEQEEFAALRLGMSELPARQREVVDLRVNHELSHAEIAGLLGITEDASRASYYQGLKRLRESLPRAVRP